jgi:hypothetical protein
VRFFDDAFTFSEARSAGHILVYFIPGGGADTNIGQRRLNWVWYVGVGEADLPRILVDRDGRQHHALLPFGGTPDSAIRDLRDLARREVHPISRLWSPQRPSRFCRQSSMWSRPRVPSWRRGVRRPAAHRRRHRQGGLRRDDLARALKRAGRNVDAGLSGFDEMQIEFGRGLVVYGVALGRRWAA